MGGGGGRVPFAQLYLKVPEFFNVTPQLSHMHALMTDFTYSLEKHTVKILITWIPCTYDNVITYIAAIYNTWPTSTYISSKLPIDLSGNYVTTAWK